MGIPVVGVIGLICASIYLIYTLYVQESTLLSRFPFITDSTIRYHRFFNSSSAMAYLRGFEVAKAVYVIVISIVGCISVADQYKSLLFRIIMGSIVILVIIQMAVPRVLNEILIKKDRL